MNRSHQPTLPAPAGAPGRSPRAAHAEPSSQGVELAAAFALALLLAVVSATIAFTLVAFAFGHSEKIEDAQWLTAFAVVVPLTVYLSGRLLARAGSPERRRALVVTAPAGLLLVCAAYEVARISGGSALPLRWSLMLFLTPALAILAACSWTLPAACARAAGRLPPARAASLAALVVVLAGGLGVAAFLPDASGDPVTVVRALIVCAFAFGVHAGLRGRLGGGKAQLALGIAVPLLLALLAWDVSFQPLPGHQDFYLGPANDIRHGRYMLVDDYSQYGVSVIYFVAAILSPLPFGYGSLIVAEGILTVVLFGAIYAVLRVATRSTAFAALGALAALLASTIATGGHATMYPSTGFLRFGVPWLLVCALVVAYRDDRPRRVPLIAAYALLGIASIWSLETALYAIATFAATAIAVALMRPGGERLRSLLVQWGAGAGAILIAVGGLTAVTLAGRGEPPHVGGYIDFLRLYSVSGFGQLPIASWSLGFLMGALYAVSLAAAFTVVLRAPGSALARPSAIVPLVSVSAFGAMAFTYFLGRSHPNNLTHVAPPFAVMLALWTALAWRARAAGRSPLPTAAVALAFACAALLAAQQVQDLANKAGSTALGAVVHQVTSGRGLGSRLSELTANPVVGHRTPAVEALVRRNVPSGAPLIIAVEPEVATEALIRLDRVDAIPIGAAEQDGLSGARRDTLAHDARGVVCGTYVVTQDAPINAAAGRMLFGRLLPQLRRQHPFRQIAAGSGFRLFRLGCGPG